MRATIDTLDHRAIVAALDTRIRIQWQRYQELRKEKPSVGGQIGMSYHRECLKLMFSIRRKGKHGY